MCRIDITKSSFMNCSNSVDEAKQRKLIYSLSKMLGHKLSLKKGHRFSWVGLFLTLWKSTFWLVLTLNIMIFSIWRGLVWPILWRWTSQCQSQVFLFTMCREMLSIIPESNDRALFRCIAVTSTNTPKNILMFFKLWRMAFRNYFWKIRRISKNKSFIIIQIIGQFKENLEYIY